MSRASAGEPVIVKPTNNIYTALAAAATVVVIFGLIVVIMRANTVFGGLLSAEPNTSLRSR